MITDAIRRIWKILSARSDIRKKERVMILHILVFSTYLLSLIAMWISYLISAQKKTSAAIAGYNWSLSVTQVCNSLTQILILHMTYNNSKFLRQESIRRKSR